MYDSQDMNFLDTILRKERRLVAGLLSGTSADAIDCAICSIEGAGPPASATTGRPRKGARVTLEAFSSTPLDPALRRKIYNSLQADTRTLAEMHAEIGIAFADALHRTLIIHGIPEESIDLVGSHGQTVYHHSGAEPKVTLQLGDGDRIAERTGFVTISDFRARDMAAGGEGAPLTPYADSILFAGADREHRRVILNLGGIANITILDRDPRKIVAFDTGPANAPLDRMARMLSNGELYYDQDGLLAAAGKVNLTILNELLAHPYIQKRPPKSTGTEMFGDAFVAALVARHGPAHPDLLATLTMFVARSVADAVRASISASEFAANTTEVIVAGGGARNPTLMARLAECLAPVRVRLSDELGVPGHAREAMAFAILANDAIAGLPTSLPRVTGARRPVTLGKLSFPDCVSRSHVERGAQL